MKTLFVLLAMAGCGWANARLQGDCTQGGYVVATQGMNSSTRVMRSFVTLTGNTPTSGCNVTVFITGSGGSKATLITNNRATTANPFTADATGHWYFEVVDGAYDITLSGSGIAAPFTLGNTPLTSPYFTPPATWSGINTRTKDNAISDIVSVKDFGALGDDSHDDTNAILAALAVVSSSSSNTGSEVYFPCQPPNNSYLVTSPINFPSNVTIRGDQTTGCRIHYKATGQNLYAFGLHASDSVTIRDIKLYSDDTGASGVVAPKIGLMLSRQTDGVAAGHHQIHDMSISGWASQALVYSIASEENSWFSVGLYLSGGGAKYVFFTADNDFLNICGGQCPTSSNFVMWLKDMHIVMFPVGNVVPDVTAAGFFDVLDPSSGDHILQDSFIGISNPSTPILNRHGSCVRFHPYAGGSYSGTGFSVKNSRCEGGDQMFYFEKDAAATSGNPSIFTDMSLIRNSFAGVNNGSTGTGFLYYAEDNTQLYRVHLEDNIAQETPQPSSLYSASECNIIDMNDGNLTFRGTVAFSNISYFSQTGTLTLMTSFANIVFTTNQWKSPGFIQLPAIAGVTSGLHAPINWGSLFSAAPTACTGAPCLGDLWVQNATIKGTPATRLFFRDGGSTTRRFLEADTDHLNDLQGTPSELFFDSLGLLTVDPGGTAVPAVSSCGTGSPSATGSDNAFLVNTGGGTVNTCTITFSNAAHWANAPVCIVTGLQTGLFFDSAPTSSTVVVRAPTSMGTSQFYVHCIGR